MPLSALVADENNALRTSLSSLLARAGFIVEEAQDELAAVCRMVDPDPPSLLLMSLDTAQVEFATVCAALREVAPQTRIVALSRTVQDTRLRSLRTLGADEFLVVTAPPVAIEARMRTLYQTLSAGRPLDGEAVIAAEVAADDGEEHAIEAVFAGDTLARTLSEELSALGFDAAIESVAADCRPLPRLTGWLPAIAWRRNEGQWAGIRVDVEALAISAVDEVLRRPSANGNGSSLTAALLAIMQQALRRATPSSIGLAFPAGSQAAAAALFPQTLFRSGSQDVVLRITLEGAAVFWVTVSAQALEAERKSLRSVRVYDVLASPARLSEGTTLLSPGVLLDAAYAERLQLLGEKARDAPPVWVFRPPPSAVYQIAHLNAASGVEVVE